jgi:hypothetical protein
LTSVEWESRKWNGNFKNENHCMKEDRSLTNFVFALKNLQHIPVRRFALKAEMNDRAIECDPNRGRSFGPIGVPDHCHAILERWADRGDAGTNDTAVDGKTVLTSSFNFQVNNIQVFEIPQ